MFMKFIDYYGSPIVLNISNIKTITEHHTKYHSEFNMNDGVVLVIKGTLNELLTKLNKGN